MHDPSRRQFVRATASAAAVGALAGCTGGNGNGNGDGNGGGSGEVPQEIQDHLSDANEYDGSIADETGSSSVTVMVGAGENDIAFDPAAVRISSGTTVTWEWTGNGGSHNVTSVEGSGSDFGSDTTDEEGHTFEQSFDDTGVQLYVCEPHRSQGMKGAIDVVE